MLISEYNEPMVYLLYDPLELLNQLHPHTWRNFINTPLFRTVILCETVLLKAIYLLQFTAHPISKDWAEQH